MSRPHIKKKVRDAVINRFGGACGYCGHHSPKLQVDHVVAYEHGGPNEESNLMPACFSCNSLKMTHPLEFFREEILSQIERARRYSVNFRTAERFGFIEVKRPLKFRFYFEQTNPQGG